MSYIQDFMKLALNEANSAYHNGEIPVGAVIVKGGNVIASASNTCEKQKNPLLHAEINCINKAIDITGDKYLTDCDMYVTLEPCPMCMGAIMNARIKRLYIGTPDLRYGASGSKYDLSETLNHKCEIYFGILEENCKNLINNFFKKMRGNE